MTGCVHVIGSCQLGLAVQGFEKNVGVIRTIVLGNVVPSGQFATSP